MVELPELLEMYGLKITTLKSAGLQNDQFNEKYIEAMKQARKTAAANDLTPELELAFFTGEGMGLREQMTSIQELHKPENLRDDTTEVAQAIEDFLENKFPDVNYILGLWTSMATGILRPGSSTPLYDLNQSLILENVVPFLLELQQQRFYRHVFVFGDLQRIVQFHQIFGLLLENIRNGC